MPTDDHRHHAVATSPQAPLAAVAELISQGASLVTATGDTSLRPQIARAWGPELLTSAGPLRICMEVRGSHESPPGTPIAVTFTQFARCRSIHAAGVIDATCPPSPEQLRGVQRHWVAYVAEAERLGISPRVVSRLIDRDALASVTVTLDEISEYRLGDRR